MSVFIVCYDLGGPETPASYARIKSFIEQYPSCHAQQSVWFVEHPGPAVALRDQLLPALDSNDRLFVDFVSGAWAGKHMPVCGKWVNDRGL